jgi:hypothetical protein
MSPQNGNSLQHEDEAESSSGRIEIAQNPWKATWQNNKGIFFILIAEVAGSCMDAIVRFLQQGEHRMHPFQVGPSRKSATHWILG